jgi:hypothetical protein
MLDGDNKTRCQNLQNYINEIIQINAQKVAGLMKKIWIQKIKKRKKN